jgi:predicted glycosyltransferase
LSSDIEEIAGHILVTVGGGFDGDTIIKTVCAYINDSFSSDHTLSYTIVLGSNSPLKISTLFEHYKNIIHNTQIVSHVESLEQFIAKAELVISMCGYNTFTELIGSNKKIIAIPRCHSGKEQLIRANTFAQFYDGIWVLPEKNLNFERLDSLIRCAISSPHPKRRIQMRGNENLVAFFRKELGYEG